MNKGVLKTWVARPIGLYLLTELILLVSIGTACSAAKVENQGKQTQVEAPPPQVADTQVRDEPPTTTRGIRALDFANFTYPHGCLSDISGKFTLASGEFAGSDNQPPMYMGYRTYGDITGEMEDEAFVTLGIDTEGGSAMPKCSYVYTLHGDQPQLLWSFYTGDRARGGLRNIYADNGHLVIERFSPTNSEGDCCPVLFTRTRYLWTGRKFNKKGKAEVLANPEKNATPVMKPTQPNNNKR